MAQKGLTEEERRELIGPLAGAVLLRRIFPLLGQLASSGTRRDAAGNRQLFYSQYAALILVGLFNPVLKSARALVAASGLKKVRQVAGGRKVSAGAFSEASSVFEPALLEGLVHQLRQQFHQHRFRVSLKGRLGQLPEPLVQRLVAVDATVLSTLPQLLGWCSRRGQGQWRLHTQMRVYDSTVLAATVTEEPAKGPSAERAVARRQLKNRPTGEPGDLLLMDRGYRSVALFNQLHQAGCDYVCRLGSADGQVLAEEVRGARGLPLVLPGLSESDREAGIVADEWIRMGSHARSGRQSTDHPLRRITVVPVPGRSSAARQGRVRSDQTGREGLVLATTLLDLPAEQVVLLYECRWQVELFFRFLKQVLGCRQLISAKTKGVEIQLYCALLASLLLALATGGNLTRRNYEMVCLYMTGWADDDELIEALAQPP